jgi:hypothetical protein
LRAESSETPRRNWTDEEESLIEFYDSVGS